MSFVIPFRQKLVKNVLVDPGHRGGVKSQPLLVHGQKRLGQNHIPYPDGRGDGLGKGSHVDHLSRLVQALERGDGLAPVPELAVIIIFYEIPVLSLPGPLQKFLTPVHRHDDSHGMLVGRHHVCHIRPGLLQPFHFHAVTVHLHRQNLVS